MEVDAILGGLVLCRDSLEETLTEEGMTKRQGMV